ncbi:hypothetical protein OS493_024772 [Desmophyllum pertusum]|uniref:Uncharacterized protein n=1 Tax=Desmophyllum pertusum TaxID=174260 RepID=A0A9W9ZAJ3_9CNID|nr:hypothetical protein OS493_024772 [Desmophyllum pertusum]
MTVKQDPGTGMNRGRKWLSHAEGVDASRPQSICAIGAYFGVHLTHKLMITRLIAIAFYR